MSLCLVACDCLSYSVLSPSIGSLLGFVVIICLGRCYFSLFQFDHYVPEAQPQSITIHKLILVSAFSFWKKRVLFYFCVGRGVHPIVIIIRKMFAEKTWRPKDSLESEVLKLACVIGS